jgi:citrate lyase subunit beta/citryl-CoA lyase
VFLDLEDAVAPAAASAAALGYDGKWVLHPGQIDVVNQAFSPGQDDYERAELILDAYRYYTTERRDDRRGLAEAGAGRGREGARGGPAPVAAVRAGGRGISRAPPTR